MQWDLSNKHFRLNLISALIVVIGLGSAIVVSITAPDDAAGVLGYEIIGGKMYPIVPDKMYVRNMELYGGQWSVVANDFTRWYDGLWQGRALAVTITWITIISAGLIYFFNNHVTFEPETKPDDPVRR